MGKEKAVLPYQPYQGFNISSMASSSQQQQCIKRNSTYSPPTRSQSMYIQKSGLDEPEILKRRVRSTRGGRSRRSTLFSSRSIPKIPQIENSVDLFEKVINALRSFRYDGAKLWNRVPKDIRNASNLKLFKKKLINLCTDSPSTLLE